MPTIIDSLVVRLGLDKKDYDTGSAKVKQSLKDTGSEAEKAGAKLKKSGKDGAEGFSEIAKSAVKFLAILGGTAVIKHFIEETIESSSALFRFAQNMETSVSTISSWKNATEIAGDSAGSLQGAIAMLSREQTRMKLTGESGLIPYFSRLGMNMNSTRTETETLLELSERFSHMDRKEAFNIGSMMGFGPIMNTLLKGPDAIRNMVASQREYGNVQEQLARKSETLREKWVPLRLELEAFGLRIMDKAIPALDWLADKFKSLVDWATHNQDFIEKFLTVLAVGLAVVALAALPLTGTIAIILLLAGAISLLWDDYEKWRDGGKSLIDWKNWKEEIDEAKAGIKSLADILRLTRTEIGFLAQAWELFKAGKYSEAWEKVKEANEIDSKVWDTITGNDSGTKAWRENMEKEHGGGVFSGVKKFFQHGRNQQLDGEAMKYFMAQGWSKQAAAGIVAGFDAESGNQANPSGSNDGGRAYGAGQWHKDRQENFRKWAGHPIQGSSIEEQWAFKHYELTQGSEKAAGDRLQQAGSAREAGAIDSLMDVRPADKMGEAYRRGLRANELFSGIPGAASAAQGAGAPGTAQAKAAETSSVNSTTDNSAVAHIGEFNVYTQATDAEGMARDLQNQNAMDYLFSAQAAAGLR